jgi:DNA mismatch repair protein MutS
MIIDEYIEYTKTHKLKYGDKCIVLMQIGSFFEIYSINDELSDDIYLIGDICNIQISRKNKSIKEVSLSNPLMAGFPLHSLNKFTHLLLNNNYTIVLVEQVTEPPNPQRKITEILSPGMNLNISNNKINNFLMVLYYEIIQNITTVGISGIDLTTGHTFVYETGSTIEDPELCNDEVFRLLTIYNPCELLILSDTNISESRKNYLLRNLNLSNILVHYKWDRYEYINSMKKLSYRVNILEKAYEKCKNNISIIENLNLEKFNLSAIALCCNIQFAYDHNSDIIKNLELPKIIENEKNLLIEYNSSIQLNILSNDKNDKPLIDILNRCITSFGIRAYNNRLLRPILDYKELNKRYDKIEYMLKDDNFTSISKKLYNIKDLERIKRKLILNKFNPQEWMGLDLSFENIIELFNSYNIDSVLYNNVDELKMKTQEMVMEYSDKLNLESCSKYNINDIKSNIFKKGVYSDIDKLENEFNEAYNIIVDIYDNINKISTEEICCKIDYNEREGYYFTMTKKRYENVKKINSKYMSNFQVKTLTSSNVVKLTSKISTKTSTIMEEKQAEIKSLVTNKYKLFIVDFITKYSDIFDNIIKFIIDIDITCCNAKNAFEFKYNRPTIDINNAGDLYKPSFIKASNARHPIIERIDDSVQYIGNDIDISLDNNNGMLLYGINASGKSCYMKTVGLNIIMAQAGMYVPSLNMIYRPYKHIFTRISGLDNIYRGMSSFTVEMTELRNILQRCNKYSLVIGDEICSGTESTSAIAIVAAGIDTLIKNSSGFIFATHLHELTNIQVVKQNIGEKKYIKVNHVHITIVDDNCIVYERKLQSGQGSSIYGIEVCKSLNMPNDFMKIAENIRKEIQGKSIQVIDSTPSSYNSDIYISECMICKAPAEEVHHINYQCESDSNGYFNEFHKNVKHNLLPLCKICHYKQHNGSLNIKSYKQTSKGIIVDYDDKMSAKSDILASDNDISEEEYIKLSNYIKKGKIYWYSRTKKTNSYRKCNDEVKIIKLINKLIDKNISNICDNDRLNLKLYDPTM